MKPCSSPVANPQSAASSSNRHQGVEHRRGLLDLAVGPMAAGFMDRSKFVLRPIRLQSVELPAQRPYLLVTAPRCIGIPFLMEAVCVSSASPDLCGGCRVTGIPTVT